MKTRVISSFALLMVLCLALAGCGRRTSNTGVSSKEQAGQSQVIDASDENEAAKNTGQEQTGDRYDLAATDLPDATSDIPYFNSMTADGKYAYFINGVDIAIETDITKYIDENVFLLTDLAYDLGWHVREPNDPAEPNVMRFWNDDEEKYVGFGSNKTDHNGGHYYDWVSYNGINVAFDRLDLYDDSIHSYYVNRGGIPPYTVNDAQVLILAYLFENASETNDPLDNLAGSGSETHYRIRQ